MDTILSTQNNDGHLKVIKKFITEPCKYYQYYAGPNNINFTNNNNSKIIYDLPFICYGKICHMRRGQLLETSQDISGYSFSGITIPKTKLSNISNELLDKINHSFPEITFNSFLHNYYRKYQIGKKTDCLSAHSDDEKSLINSTVIGIGFTENPEVPRIIRFRNKSTKKKYDIKMYSGDLYLMEGITFQEEFTHEIVGYKTGDISKTNVISITARKF